VALRVAGQGVEYVALSDARPNFADHLAFLWKTLVEDEEWILRKVGSVTLAKNGLIPKEGGTRVKDAVEAFLRFTDKPIVASKEAVSSGLAQACADGELGLGRGASLARLQTKYCQQAIEVDASEDGLWIIPPFEREAVAPPTPGMPLISTPAGLGAGGTAVVTKSDTGKTTAAWAVRRIVVRGRVPTESWADIFRAFVNPAARMGLSKLHLGVQFELEAAADKPLDRDDPAVKNMREAAKQLGLDFEEIE
jgi:hypothetical protein